MPEAADRKDRLADPIVKEVGDRTAKVLESSFGITTVGDLLRHYPRYYAERGDLTDLADLKIDEQVTVVAEVAKVSRRPMRARRGTMLEVEVTDGKSRLILTFFNQAWRERDLKPGRTGLFAGKVSEFRGRRQLSHPDFRLLTEGEGTDEIEEFAGALIPVYPAAAQLPSWKIHQCLRPVLDTLGALPDPVPADVRERKQLLDLAEAFRKLHRPEDWAEVTAARKRLRWDEAFVLQVVLAQRRHAARSQPAVPRVPNPGGLLDAFDERLPFTLTDGQQTVGAEVAGELAGEHPMHRLLQGEVGSGKTLIALRAMLAVADAGGQAVLLAPTEVLAQQHHRSIEQMMGPLAQSGMLGGDERGTKVVLLTGSMSVKEKRAALLAAASGEAGIVIGTHAVIQETVQFADLGLVVVDEQHRFGVEQRDALRGKASRPPHLLVMTATPIPRTVAMTVFGDLEISTLTELPHGRSPIATHVVPAAEKPAYVARTWERIREEVAQGHQAYVVCPRIGEDGDESEEGTFFAYDPDNGGGKGAGDGADAGKKRPPTSVLETLPKLAEGPLAGLRVAMLHGRMAPDDKDAVMRDFAAGEVDVLVATTVIEVGVDVPNATVMVVMDADRFGVSQLHQLRGRVGRGSAPGLCLLLTEMPPETPARERLDAVAATLDGFELSRIDLEFRKEGDVLGAAQSGRRSSLRMLRVLRDENVIREARQEALDLIERDPGLEGEPMLAAAVAELVEEANAEYLEKG